MASAVVSCETTEARAAVVEAGRRWAVGQYELVRLVAELDESMEWALDGAPTCAHWVAEALDVEVCTAREWLRIGRALRTLPAIASGFEARRLSYSKVRALSRVATPGNERELCAIAERVPAGRLAHALASWLQRHETPEETVARHTARTGLTSRLEPDGMGLITLRLPPLEHGAVMAAIDAQLLVSQSSFHASADASGRGRHRHPTARQQRVARERHANRCVECGSTDLLQDDHVPGYAESRRTVVDQLQPRCPCCHHARHRGQEPRT